MEKSAPKKWKCLYLLSVLALLVALVMGGSWLTSEEGQQSTRIKQAFAVGFFALALVSFLAAKVGSWFFHDED